MTSQMQAPPQRAPGLLTLAVRDDGRRSASHPVADAAVLATVGAALVILDHAGPATATWSVDRPLGASAHPEPLTGRTPRGLDDAAWADVTAAFAAAARACRTAGVSWALGLDDEGLLHDALRHAPARALSVVDACTPDTVVLPAEDLCPGGLDATDGIELARALTARGVKRLLASAGTRAFSPLRTRRKGGTAGGPDALLAAAASAAWLVGRVDATIEAIVPAMTASPDVVAAIGRALGLSRVWIESATAVPEDA